MRKITYLEPRWHDWIVSNLGRCCTQESLVAEMVAKDFEPEFARAAVAQLALAANGASPAPRADDEADYAVEPSRIPAGNVLMAEGHAIQVAARLTTPELLLFAEVLSAEECAELIRLSQQKLERSTIVDPATGKHLVIENRTSFGTYFGLRENDFIARLDQRLAELLCWPVDHAEGLQIIHYHVGGEYKPHFDYFPPADPGSAAHLVNGGQRVASLIMYLNDVAEGGATIFPEIGLSVLPRRGWAAYFSYCNSRNQVDPLTLHGGAPVRRGEKWIATKWLRQQRRT